MRFIDCDYLKEAVLFEAAFTKFWDDAPKETLRKLMDWDGSLAVLYRRAFVLNAVKTRATTTLTGGDKVRRAA